MELVKGREGREKGSRGLNMTSVFIPSPFQDLASIFMRSLVPFLIFVALLSRLFHSWKFLSIKNSSGGIKKKGGGKKEKGKKMKKKKRKSPIRYERNFSVWIFFTEEIIERKVYQVNFKQNKIYLSYRKLQQYRFPSFEGGKKNYIKFLNRSCYGGCTSFKCNGKKFIIVFETFVTLPIRSLFPSVSFLAGVPSPGQT